jgi:hypothetical protein
VFTARYGLDVYIPLSLSFHQRSILFFIYVMLLSTGLNLSKSIDSYEFEDNWRDKYFRIFLQSSVGCSPVSHRSGPASIPDSLRGEQTDTGTGFLRILRCHPVSIFLPMLHTHIHLYTAVIRTTGAAFGQECTFTLF